MDEPYRVEVLHIVNPHVIFLESQGLENEPIIEQVGLYGILPVDKTINIDGSVLVERCDEWPIAANAILKEGLGNRKCRVLFKPIHVSERSTIFDSKIYKFGNIIVESKEHKSLTHLLRDTACAVLDEPGFVQKLNTGSLNLKLDMACTEKVLNAIKTYYMKHGRGDHDWQETLNKQTVLHQTTKAMTAQLTEENLKLLELNSLSQDIDRVIEMKRKDLAYCQDADLVSVGCGLRRPNSNQKRTQSSNTSTNDSANSPRYILQDIKEHLDAQQHLKASVHDKLAHKSIAEAKKMQYTTPNNKNKTNLCDMGEEWDDIHNKYVSETNPNKMEVRNDNFDKDYFEIKNSRPDFETETTKTSQIRKEKINKKTDEEDYDGHKSNKSLPVKQNTRRIIYCPDMTLSTDNVKNFVPIVVNEKSPENFANTIEEPIEDMNKKSDKVPRVDSKANNQINKSVKGKLFDDFNVADDDVWNKTEDRGNTKTDRDKNTVTDVSYVKLESQNVIQTAHTSRLNMKLLQDKLQAIKMSRKDSVSSKSDLSCDQTDYSSNDSKKVQKADEYHLVPKASIKSSENRNVENSTTKVLLSSSLQARLQLLQKCNVPKVDPNLTKVENNLTKNDLNVAKMKTTSTKQILIQEKESTLAENQRRLNAIERNVNPFRNLEGSKSVFVENLVSPTLMVHTKNNNLVLPKCELSDIPFKADIRLALKAMRVQKVKRLQTVTWNYILRGHSMFIIGPSGNGKTVGYVPAVCNLICDARSQLGLGPICIIVCATALSVSNIANLCKRFLTIKDKIVTFYPGVDPAKVRVSLLNGCSLLICTAPALVNLLETDFGVDLRRLGILVFDDCERLSQVYLTEIQTITQHVNLMLKNRADKAMKVQYVIASREWCDFMTPLAKKAPDTIIAIGASQECVLYSKTHTSVNIVNSDEKKMDYVLEFLEEIDFSKRTVIVCRRDEEVTALAAALKDMRFTVFSCNNSMDLHDLYNLSEAWNSYKEPISGPILVCCDGNLTHLNITNANYLVHYSLPSLFSVFCKRFFVIIDNYASIFAPNKTDVKIKILMDKTNVEQLPKILHFVKRCTNQELTNLDDVLQDVMREKDVKKAESLTPICNSMLMLGECVDIWNCAERHTVFDTFDGTNDWMPKNGVVTFKITSFDTAVTYSAQVLSIMTKSETVKFPNNLNTLALKMGRHYSKEINRKLHGKPNVGDICAVATQQSLFERCRVLKVIPSDRKNHYHVLINLLDKEQMTMVSDVELYYLPEDLKAIESYVVQVRLANIQPKDKDVTFSEIAKEHLQKLTEVDQDSGLYMRGKVAMSLGNTIFVDTAEACIDLSNMGETIVRRNFKHELIGRHADSNPQHIDKLKKLCGIVEENVQLHNEKQKTSPQAKKNPKWAHLDKGDFTAVYISTIFDADKIYLRLAKFDKLMDSLYKDISAYVENAPEIDEEDIFLGNIVLGELPEDKTYERIRIDEIIDNRFVKCFFVDYGDWRNVAKDKLKPITENFLHRLPFQTIECRLVGVKPPGSAGWPEFSVSWLDDICFEGRDGNSKELFVKYFTKEPASATGGHKYGIVLIDTHAEQDVKVNEMMIELNLAKVIDEEVKYFDEMSDFASPKASDDTTDDDVNDNNSSVSDQKKSVIRDLVPVQEKYESQNTNNIPLNILLGRPIRSVPLVNSDSESDISDKWDVNVDDDMMGLFGKPTNANTNNVNKKIKEIKSAPKTNVKALLASKSDQINEIEERNDKDASDSNSEISSNLPITKNNSQNSTKESLDSDDINTEDERNNKIDTNKNVPNDVIKEKSINDTLDSDDFSSSALDQTFEGTIDGKDVLRKPKVVWKQNKNTVTLKIMLIGVEKYVFEIKDRQIKFQSWHNDTQYGFEIELYGAILKQKCVHSNKGQYIYVSLTKLLSRSWLNLAKDFATKKWIVYDVDAVGSSSEEDSDGGNEDARKVIRYNHEKMESASEDEDVMHDLTFAYKR